MLCKTCAHSSDCNADWTIRSCASYKLRPGLHSNKEAYLIQFETKERALYWMSKFLDKFKEEVVSVNKTSLTVEMPEAIYYFYSKRKSTAGEHFTETYPEEAIYIIVDDIERTRLDSYNGDRGIAIYKGDMHVESNSKLF